MAQYRFEGNNNRNNGAGTYVSAIEGTAVRVLSEPSREERPYIDRENEKQKRLREKRLPMSLPSLFLLAVATCCVAGVCVMYLEMSNEVLVSTKRIAQLEQQYQNLKDENDELELSISSLTDYAYVYRVATEELGMQVPTEDQVKYFNETEKGYVIQYDAIPGSEN